MSVQDASRKLDIAKSYITAMFKTIQKSRTTVQGTITRYVHGNKLDEARRALPALCSTYESELAYRYLLECMDTVKNNMAQVLEAREIPMSLISEVAAICYAKDVVNAKDLKSFVVDFLGKTRRPEEIEALAHSNHVADSLSHLVQRGSFRSEELITFARRMQADLGMDLSWFLDDGRSADPNAIYSVTVLDHVLPLPASAPRVDAVAVPPPSAKLPDFPIFKSEDYNRMTVYVDNALKDWNTVLYLNE
jgi:hypothetical protein